MYQNFCRCPQDRAKPFSPAAILFVHARTCPDTSRSPPRSISTSESGVTRKNRHVPCFDRSQSSAVMALSRAMIRSWAISSLKSSPRLPGGRENLRREHDPGERDRDLRYDRDVEDPLRHALRQLDNATLLCNRDRFCQRPVGRGPRLMGCASFSFRDVVIFFIVYLSP